MYKLIAIAISASAVGSCSPNVSPAAVDGRMPELALSVDRVELSPVPVPVSNNAVAAVTANGTEYLISFAGLGAGRTYADTHARTFVFDGTEWHEADPLPGGVGRLAAAATSAKGKAWVFGGYSVAEDGSEESTPWTHSFDPVSGRFEEHAPMPVPVDDSVAVTYRDRFVYLISGWHDYGNVNLVQRYDIETDTWDQATPTPGPAVFGHAGGIFESKIVYCDGVAVAPRLLQRRRFEAVRQCFLGVIDAANPRRIDWQEIPPHPGPARYRMAAAGIGAMFVFIGGSDNPYNYDGIGYNGEPSQPVAGALLYGVGTNSWLEVATTGEPTMDHRGLVLYEDDLVTIGGMHRDQRVTNAVYAYWSDEE